MQPLSGKARSETQIIEQARSLMLAEQTRDIPLEANTPARVRTNIACT
jgi:hypothetical protein